MTDKVFKGVVVPTVTPLTPDEKVDTKSLRRLINYLIDAGVHGIWAAGTTGEFAALEDEQRLIAIETTVEEVNGRVPVIGNVSGVATKVAVNLARALAETGLDGVAATPPYYYNHDQGELIDHFRAISAAASQPLWIYNFPAMTKLTMEPATIATLAADGTVVGMKDSSGAGEALAELVVLCEQDHIEMYRFIGSIYRTTTTRRVGAHGVIPGGSNLAAASLSKAWEAGEAGDETTAVEHLSKAIATQKISKLAKAGGRNAASASGVKSALKIMGIIDYDTVTSPMRSLTEEEKAYIPGILREVGLLN
jgi:4-hydroxy-tetrahydrodipicolinate synthase